MGGIEGFGGLGGLGGGLGGLGGLGGFGGGAPTQIIIIVVVTTPEGTQRLVPISGANYQQVMSRVRNFASAQRAVGNNVRFVPR
jgi:hypothetical protein